MELKSDPYLINNLMTSFQDTFLLTMRDETRETLCKDGIRHSLNEIVAHLNEVHLDVRFEYRWIKGIPASHFKEDQLFVGGFDRLKLSDEDEFGEVADHLELLYETNIAELGIILFYHWHQKCSLGHTHRTTRFYSYSMPKLVELISFHMLKPDYKEFTKLYVPNFFY